MIKNSKSLVFVSLAVAIVFITTVVIKFPNGFDGYFNLGDAGIFVFASMLSPFPSFLVGGIGSALADIAGGYTQFAVFTLVIKGFEGLMVSYCLKRFHFANWLAYAIGAGIMVVGYALTSYFLYQSIGVALGESLMNGLQGIIGVVVAVILVKRISRVME